MREIFILIPSLSPVGPVKGAVALANTLVVKRKVTLAVLKPGLGVNTPIDPAIDVIFLYKLGGWLKRLSAYKQYLQDAGGKNRAASISSCFSPDMFNLLCRKYAVTCASVRANNLHNYRLDYGWKGVVLAVLHFSIMRGFNHVVVMTESMAKQVAGYLGRSPVIIGNFIDESNLERFRRKSCNFGKLRFVFVGSLSVRKKPLLLIDALEDLCLQGYDVSADIIGNGPLRKEILEELSKRGLEDTIRIHGHLDEVYSLVASADVFVLPSLSEGLSRSCLEALYLGLPAVMRDIDGNNELIQSGVNGFLFNDDTKLSMMMLSAAKLSRKYQDIPVSLLPSGFRQSIAADAYLNLVENNSK